MKMALIHGWAMHSGIWGPLLPPLQQQASLQLLELPGHGRQPMLQGGYTLSSLADALAEQLQPGSIVLGWSLGAMTAMQMACTYPQKVRALILLSATPRFVNTEGDWSHGVGVEVLQGFVAELERGVERTLNRFLSLQLGNNSSAEQLRELRQLVKSRPVPTAEVLQAGLDVLATADLRTAVDQLQLPVLLVHGARDRLMPLAAARWLVQRLPVSELTIIDKAGHAPFLSHSAEVVSAISAFVQQQQEDR